MATSSSTTAVAPPPLVVFPFGEPDLRLEDYLDDKLQSSADLDPSALDALLVTVGEQNDQLQAQLDDTARELDAARAAAAARALSLQAAVAEFAAVDAAIGGRLEAMGENGEADGQGGTPQALVQRLTPPMQQLRRVTLAHDYLVLLQDVAAWTAAARAALPDRPKEALGPYGQLRRLATRLASESSSGGGGGVAPHLVAHIGAVADGLWAEMNATMRTAFAALLAERGWPDSHRMDAAVRADETWRDGFARLLDLQRPEILASPDRTLVLLPIDVMAELLVKEFRYHFLTAGRKTSDPLRIGDVCIPWFFERTEQWAGFLRSSFADLLASRLEGTAAGARMVYRDPACALAGALLPVMAEKVDQTVGYVLEQLRQQQKQQEEQEKLQSQAAAGAAEGLPAADSQPLTMQSMLSSVIVMVMEFDDDVRKKYGYDGHDGGAVPSSDTAWPGLATPLLDAHFALFLKAEKDDAQRHFRERIDGDGADARRARETLLYDYFGERSPQTKHSSRSAPTLAAERFVSLLSMLTGRYMRARRFSHRLRFFIDVQITLLDRYHDRLRASLEAYAAMTSTVGRALHGVTREQLAALEGTGGLEVLCRVYGSAEFIVHTLGKWGDEAFFVQLWGELQARAAKAEDGGGPQAEDQGHLAGMSTEQVRQRTSAMVGGGSDGATGAGGTDTGMLFDETIAAFSARRQAAQDFLVAALADSHRKAFRPYVLRTHWTPADTRGEGAADKSDEEAAPAPDHSITPELDEPLRVMRRNLEFLAPALGAAPLRRVVRGALERLQDMLWGDVLLAQRFTALGAAQFARDVAAVAATVERVVPRGAAALEGLREGLVLLTLPVAATSDAGGARTATTLQHASDRVFTDNTQAKQLLQELGLTTLTPGNARQILQRRVEMSG